MKRSLLTVGTVAAVGAENQSKVKISAIVDESCLRRRAFWNLVSSWFSALWNVDPGRHHVKIESVGRRSCDIAATVCRVRCMGVHQLTLSRVPIG